MKLHRIFRILSILILLASPKLTFAISAADTTSIGQVAEHLTFGTHLITQLMHVVSFCIGAALLVMGLLYVKAHRENPKFMPLDKVVLYIVCGVILLSLPFFNKIFGETGSAIDLQKREKQGHVIRSQDADAPLDFGNDYNH